MATVVSTYTNDAGQTINVYESGAEYNTVEHRLVKPAEHTLLTAERVTSLNLERIEKKRSAARRGANAALARQLDGETGEPLWENPQDLDFIEALTEAQMDLAMASNAYSTKAAEFVVETTGYNERHMEPEPSAPSTMGNIRELTALLQFLKEAILPPRDVIDGKVNE